LAWAAASAPAAPDAANATPNATPPPEAKEAAPKSAVAPPDSATELRLHFRAEADLASTNAQVLKLRGADARQQLLATARLANGALRDQTHQVTYEVNPTGIVRVEPGGLVTPLQDGQATITAKTANGLSSSLAVAVEKFKESTPINFANQIVPIFTKTGCNGGGCHENPPAKRLSAVAARLRARRGLRTPGQGSARTAVVPSCA
jgi:hypothetical protein